MESELEELARGVRTGKIIEAPSTILRARRLLSWEPEQQAPRGLQRQARVEAAETGSLNTNIR